MITHSVPRVPRVIEAELDREPITLASVAELLRKVLPSTWEVSHMTTGLPSIVIFDTTKEERIRQLEEREREENRRARRCGARHVHPWYIHGD